MWTINGSMLGIENSTGSPYDPANVVAFIDSRTRNVARQRFSGLDLSIRYRITIGGDRELSLSATGTFLQSRQQLISGAPWTRLAATLFNQIGRAHVRTPVPNAHLVCRLMLDKTQNTKYNVLSAYLLF